MYATVEVQRDIDVQCVRHICSGAFGSNGECMFTSAPGHMFIAVSSYMVYISI